jgi:hypothetical protein
MQKFILNNRLGAKIHRQEWQPGKEQAQAQAQKRMREKPQKESNERQLTTTWIDRLQGTV